MTDIKVLIVDDSAVVRQVLSAVLNQASGIQVIDVAIDPVYAMEKMNKQWPDVIVLDVEMPRMDGITFLKKLMAQKPTPVVICSTLTEKGAKTTLQALAAGAVSIVTKPQSNLRQFLTESADELVQAVRAAAKANMRCVAGARAPVDVPPRLNADAILSPAPIAMARTTESIVAIGTSTGGTQAWNRFSKDCRGYVQALSWCSICRRSSPPPSPSVSITFVRSRSARRYRAIASFPGAR